MSSSTTALNWPLLSIPAYYIFTLAPHAYAQSILTAAGYKVNNANPKASLSPSSVQGKVPDDVFQKYQRAENAQSNNQEQMPLFAVAVLASLFAERVTMTGIAAQHVGGPTIGDTGLSAFIPAFFAVRTMYVVSYIAIGDHAKSFIRSALWAVGVGLSCYQIYKAAVVLGA